MTNGADNGAGIVTTNIYNDRLQPILLQAGYIDCPVHNPPIQCDPPPPFFSLCYDFHLGVAVSSIPCSFSAYTSGDNGNVFQVINNVDSTRSAAFDYDSLNRISQANTINTTSSNCWGEVYTIDAWGNLTNRGAPSGMSGSCITEGLNATATTQNQLGGIGIVYDPAGNVVNDGVGNTPTYDAENRIVTDAGVTYYYDSDGVRIEKSTGTMYWPGPGGETLTEATLAGVINEEYVYFNGQRIARVDRPSGTVHYYFSTHLGSHTMVTNATGDCEQDIDYYPYGGVVVDHCPNVAQHYKFTGKERDAESGLDNFGARYHASSLGRFMTPDPLHIMKQKLIDPQQWNMYAYVRNNPLRFTDPTGMYTCSDNNKCKSGQYKDFEKARQRDLKSKDSAVVAAAKAYGDPTKDNGVSVKFGDPGKGHDGSTAASVVYADGKFQGKVDVTIKSGLSGTALDAAVGHEGVHVGDAQGYFSTINGGQSDMSKDLTHSQTEMNAYRVTASIWAASGNTASYGQCGGGSCNYGPGMTAGQIDATTMILLSNPANGYNESTSSSRMATT